MSFLKGMQFIGFSLLSLASKLITDHTTHTFILYYTRHQALPLINVEPKAFIDFTAGRKSILLSKLQKNW